MTDKNPFKAKVAPQTTTSLPCLVPFVIWQEVGVDDQDPTEENSEITKNIKEAGKNLKDAILDTSAKKECETENGIFIKNVCHYY